jgi:arylsulfatase
VAATQALPAGKVQVKVDVAYQGGLQELGKSALVSMTVNGTKVAEGPLPKTIPATISIQEGLDIGEDVGSAVDFTYQPPFKFTGTIEKVTFDLK